MAKLINQETNEEIKLGDEIISFRGEKYILNRIEEPHKPSSTGKLYVTPADQPEGMSRSFYPTVFNAKILS